MTMTKPWRAHIVTQSPFMFPGPLAHHLAGQALQKQLWTLTTTNLSDFGKGVHKRIDSPPAGGGPGMVLQAEVAYQAVCAARREHADLPLVWLSAAGTVLTQQRIADFAQGPGLMLFCSRFEGVDARAMRALGGEEISLGDYILAGGDIAAMAVLDAILRLLPNVMGCAQSAQQDSFSDGLLEHAQYTRPALWRRHGVPKILLSGHHDNIAAHRLKDSQSRTRTRRPDLWRVYQRKKNIP